MLYSACPGIFGRKTVAKLTALLFALVLVLQPAAVSAAPDTYNIANTNSSGLSNNRVNQFNVGPNGLVLVNSASNVVSQLAGGTVAGNANLTNGPASVILFQVTGTGASALNGATEIAGQKAAFILANPNGINVNGAKFINAGRVVLTTGTPKLNSSGELSSFLVEGGKITVEGAGLDATGTDRLDIISRAIALNAYITNAKEVNLVAGANRVNYNTLAAKAIGGTGTAPAVAIDVSALGGMYAEKITLVATEKGVGVNNLGTINATAGNVVIDSAGKVRLSNSTSATGDIRINAQSIDLSGGMMDAGGNVALKASKGDITNTNYGMVLAGGDVTVVTPGLFDNSQGVITAGGSFAINAVSVNNTEGFLSAGGDFNVTLGSTGNYGFRGYAKCTTGGSGGGTPPVSAGPYTLNNTDGSISAGNDLTITVAGKAATSSSATPVYAVNNTNGQMSAGNNLTINVTAASGKSICGTPPGTVYAVNNTNGHMDAGNDLIITAQDGSKTGNSSYKSVAKCGSSSYPSASATKTNYFINNTNGQMSAGNDITITVQGATATQSSHKTRCGGGTTTVTAPVTVDNTGGSIAALNNLTIFTKGTVNNAGGQLTAGQNTAVTAFGVQNQQGLVSGDASVTITTQKAFDTTAGTVTGGTVTIPNQI